MAISVSSVKVNLYKSLIFSLTRFGGIGDWSQSPASYSYQDKQFLNKMFSQYGGYHLGALIDVIYKLHYDKLLPEIIVSMRKAFQTHIDRLGKNSFRKVINEKEVIVLLIITKVFLDFDKQVKEDKEMTESFEVILEMLRDIDYPEAAVILDEFRVH